MFAFAADVAFEGAAVFEAASGGLLSVALFSWAPSLVAAGPE